jgi:hypothetical protein
MFHVYELRDGEVCIYVGKGNSSRRRLSDHIRQAERLKEGKVVKNRILAGTIKRIIDQGRTVQFIIRAESDDEALIFAIEQELISFYGRKIDGSGTLANLTMGGEGTAGNVMSEESKARIGAASRGRKDSPETREKKRLAALKRRHSPETKAKISQASKSRITSKETKDKISKSGKGRKLSIETRRRISESKIGEKNPMFGRFGHEHPRHSKNVIVEEGLNK